VEKIHNVEFYSLYSSPNSGDPTKKNIWEGQVARMGDMRGAYRVLVGKTKGKRPLGRPRRRRGG
jgi:hypothetical protein